MKISKLCSLFVLIGLSVQTSAIIDAQWVTIARKIITMRNGDTDIANLIIDAGTFNVVG